LATTLSRDQFRLTDGSILHYFAATSFGPYLARSAPSASSSSTHAFDVFLIPSSRDWTRLLDSEDFCSKLSAGKCTHCDRAIKVGVKLHYRTISIT
jgi:hypothetical protein